MEATQKKVEWVMRGKGRLKPNKKSTNEKAPNFVGSIVLDSEYLQKLIDKDPGRIILPLSMWLKDSQWNDDKYVDLQTSEVVTIDGE